MTNTCICCGAEIPEGTMVCQTCVEKSVGVTGDNLFIFPGRCNGKTLTQAKYIKLRIRDIRREAVEEALTTLKARLNYDIQKYEGSTIDYAFKLGAEKFKLDVDMAIDELIHQYRTGELK